VTPGAFGLIKAGNVRLGLRFGINYGNYSIMQSGNLKTTLLVLAIGGAVLWKMGAGLFGPAVEPGKVTILTSSNFHEVRKTAKTLLAVYMRPG
jgi:hypothetical protein